MSGLYDILTSSAELTDASQIEGEVNPDSGADKYDTVMQPDDLIELIEGTNEYLAEEEEEEEDSASKDTEEATPRPNLFSMLQFPPKPKSIISSSGGKIKTKKGASKIVRESVASRASKISKASNISRPSKTGKLSKHKKKNIKRSSRNSLISRQSELSSISTMSFHRISGMPRSSRTARVSVTSADSSLEMKGVTLRKAKKTIQPEPKKEDIDYGTFHSESDDETEISETSPEYDGSFESEMAIHKRHKILDILKDLPDISDLSDVSLHVFSEPQITIKEVDAKDQLKDEGSFVAAISSFDDISSDESLAMRKKRGVLPSTTSSVSKSMTIGSDDTLLNLPDLSSHEILAEFKPPVERTSYIQNITEKLIQVKVRGSQIDFLDAEEREQKKVTQIICRQFMDEVIGRAVTKCEEESSKLMRWLDKNKLWLTLKTLLEKLHAESAIREKLERLTAEHFLRKKRYVFIKQPKSFDAINYKRLRTAVIEFDRQLALAEKINEKIEVNMKDLHKELEDQENYSDQKLIEFENKVRQTLLVNDGFVHLKELVNKILHNMSTTRNELSNMRLELLFANHRFAEMLSKLDALEDLGYGLKMQDYLSRQVDTQMLSLKIEERNAELTRLHNKINCDVHALAHLKNKEHMSRRTQNRMKLKLLGCIQWKNYYRSKIYQGKLKHNAIIREIHKLKTDGSLLEYPILLLDFDKTVEEVNTKRKCVEKLRNTHKHLTQRISTIEQMLENSRKANPSSRASFKSSLFEGSPLRVTALSLVSNM